MTTTLANLARQAAKRLRGRLSPQHDAALEAEVLARHVLGWDRARWLADSRMPPPPGFAERFAQLVERRMRHEPVAYITGTKEFYGLDFDVTPAVLIPRPGTEMLVGEALRLIDAVAASGRAPVVADVGTGSGCIAIAIAVTRPNVTVVATDVSEAALEIARRNARRHHVEDRAAFIRSSLLDGVPPVDVIVANLPYLPLTEKTTVMPDVWAYEPVLALFGGADGTDVVRALIRQVGRLQPAAPLVLEFAQTQNDAIRRSAADAGLRLTRVFERDGVAVLER